MRGAEQRKAFDPVRGELHYLERDLTTEGETSE
jgi:hypothetical protein